MKQFLLKSLLISLVIIHTIIKPSISNTLAEETISDGPYVFVNDGQLDIHWVCENKAKSASIKTEFLPYSFAECGLSANINTLVVPEQKIAYNGDFTVAALSDLHGQYDLMLKLLKNNQIIGADNTWQFADNHLVITGDLFDRGDKVTEIAWFLYRLEQEAIAAGGNLHLLLGNHEVMVLNNHLKYLNKKYVKSAQILNIRFPNLFRQKSILGAWIRSKNVLVKVNDSLFLHGGLHPDLAEEKISLVTINNIFKEHLVEKELEAPRVGMSKFLHTTNGPIWYRGYFNDIKASASEIDSLLSHFKVSRIVVGHTSQEQVVTRYEAKVIGIDTSIKNGKNGEILFIDGNKKWRGSLQGKKLALE